MPFHSKRSILWKFNVAGYKKRSLVLYAKCPIFLPDFHQIRNFSTLFMKVPSAIFHGNPSSESCADTYRLTDGRTYMTTLKGAFRDNANAPKYSQPFVGYACLPVCRLQPDNGGGEPLWMASVSFWNCRTDVDEHCTLLGWYGVPTFRSNVMSSSW
jgi:hypothetical protein